ncbi:MAG: transketolase [Parcubacteria group bacterium CG08_land_8_20_14_0_20_48_21]|nr:MAG: transketolase [Parcubacteria group bacterium CG2_30_48_51]PIS32509.1 MAG: transketolase [Parcubacteria group bacterium CG08_land_8_20_14_0_20_48_21]PIW79532.1 MAG: transketolase [Parcubacteria group bacterium CG_4_8_14_3_um_filter_48_16]PIY78094.1 MAG: transketolase [Parcubacteria group bacterium CG_4_10_14_0_8_um_filter_48_154]PIZ77661.1 MAG: transketolase [bacterium CG_4_10_14_0_2_um_filter_48_144]PJC39870.1 MAG: transketolase [Parcubacteria group bacterium CG_4_9_14_0_2_um_filter_48
MHLAHHIFSSDVTKKAIKTGFGEGLVKAAQKDKRVVGLCADVTASVAMDLFAAQFPERFVECGVAEQNMAGIASGLALAGKIPFMASYAAFTPGMNWGQIRLAISHQRVNVKIIGSHAGLSAGADGATHQALEDIALTRVLPNITVVVPCDAVETEKATQMLARTKGPAYLRLMRHATPVMTTQETPFTLGKAEIFRKGNDVTLIAAGPLLYEALGAAELLAQRHAVSLRVINCHTIKPLDAATLVQAARETGALVTLEEHQIAGGLGSAVAELVSSLHPVPVLRMGVNDTFGESGKPEELLQKHGLTKEKIVQQALKALLMKRKNTHYV